MFVYNRPNYTRLRLAFPELSRMEAIKMACFDTTDIPKLTEASVMHSRRSGNGGGGGGGGGGGSSPRNGGDFGDARMTRSGRSGLPRSSTSPRNSHYRRSSKPFSSDLDVVPEEGSDDGDDDDDDDSDDASDDYEVLEDTYRKQFLRATHHRMEYDTEVAEYGDDTETAELDNDSIFFSQFSDRHLNALRNDEGGDDSSTKSSYDDDEEEIQERNHDCKSDGDEDLDTEHQFSKALQGKQERKHRIASARNSILSALQNQEEEDVRNNTVATNCFFGTSRRSNGTTRRSSFPSSPFGEKGSSLRISTNGDGFGVDHSSGSDRRSSFSSTGSGSGINGMGDGGSCLRIQPIGSSAAGGGRGSSCRRIGFDGSLQ